MLTSWRGGRQLTAGPRRGAAACPRPSLRRASAILFEPGGARRGREIARSVDLEWSPILPPLAQPEIVQAARGLARSLVAAGWQPAERGPEWYAMRFVWTGPDEPAVLGVAAAHTS